jgi:hypothetical protein
MDSDPKSPQVPEKPLAERLVKYLPIFVISHALVTIPTFIISIALAYATFVQADATKKIQMSETWPYVSYGTSNARPDGTNEISFVLQNNGVGPARLEAMEFLYKGKPMPNPREFLKQCCAGDVKFAFMSAPVTGVLRPGEKTEFIRLARTEANAPIWEKLGVERWSVVVRSCYCSIFDDCWVADNRQKRPQQVDECPADWKTFDERPYAGTPGPSRAGF